MEWQCNSTGIEKKWQWNFNKIEWQLKGMAVESKGIGVELEWQLN